MPRTPKTRSRSRKPRAAAKRTPAKPKPAAEKPQAEPTPAPAPTADEHVVADLESGFAAKLEDRDHSRGCPVVDGDGGRVEGYPSVKPAQPSNGVPAKQVTVVRCIECGGHVVVESDFETVIAEIESEVTA